MKNRIIILIVCTLGTLSNSCDYLDLAPDNIPTMEMVFNTRQTAEKMLMTCYSYMPEHGNVHQNPGLGSSEEVWNFSEKGFFYVNSTSYNIALGNQNTNNPYLNFWDGGNGGKNMFEAINDCNIFIENVDKVPDMNMGEKVRWKSEVKVLKAFYHYWLLQLYGPIPYMDKNLDVSSSLDQLKTEREPVDVVIAKIVGLLDEVIEEDGLPLNIRAQLTEMGRLTKPAALAIKAKVLTLDASPLFNGNSDFAGYANKEGVPFINPVFDLKKWEAARDALKEAIDVAHEAGHELYKFDENLMTAVSETTELELTLRNTITARYNKELIWGLGDNGTQELMKIANPPLTQYQQGSLVDHTISMHNATLDVAEQFYTNKGIPIQYDKSWEYEKRYEVADRPIEGHEYYIAANERTARLNYYREPRYYAWIGFDRGLWYNEEAPDDKHSLCVYNRAKEVSGRMYDYYNITGFYTKKLVNYKLVMTKETNTINKCSYPFPIIRLSDLYLLYAEVLNECKNSPDSEVYEYIQLVRNKAGLDKETGGLKESWAKYSTKPEMPLTKTGLREVIHQERLIELSFEGQRFFDLRRWRKSMEYCNRPIRGWNVLGKEEAEYYQVRYIYFPKFLPKNYFWPIWKEEIYRNEKLQQSPFWD